MSTPAPWQDRANPIAGALDEALRLAYYGTPSFPCRPDKRPACPHGFKDATADAAQLAELWRQYPGPLVGVPTGASSGVFVLDIDSAKHPEADEWLEANAPRLPDTRHHRTRSGGLHLLFKHRAGLKNSTSKLAPGVDTRGEGGFIIWWPFHLGLGADHRMVPLADVPQWLVEALNPPPPPPAKIIPFRPRSQFGNVAPAMSRIEGIVATVARARQGERNAVTFWGACRIRDMISERELDHVSGGHAFAALAEASRRTGLSEIEITRTITSATRPA
jgi:Bifunctional DNA primase/polymerase, N-terminal